MTAHEIIETLKSFCYSKEIYIFGSILKNKRNFHDIDLLILYKCKEELVQKRNDLEGLSFYYPLDIYFMTFEEEKELDFINTVMAINIINVSFQNNSIEVK